VPQLIMVISITQTFRLAWEVLCELLTQACLPPVMFSQAQRHWVVQSSWKTSGQPLSSMHTPYPQLPSDHSAPDRAPPRGRPGHLQSVYPQAVLLEVKLWNSHSQIKSRKHSLRQCISGQQLCPSPLGPRSRILINVTSPLLRNKIIWKLRLHI
jgi:hypothetical protein